MKRLHITKFWVLLTVIMNIWLSIPCVKANAVETSHIIISEPNVAFNYAIITSGKAVTHKDGYHTYRYAIDETQIGQTIKLELNSYGSYCPCIFSSSQNVKKGFIAKASDGDVTPQGTKWLITTSQNADNDRLYVCSTVNNEDNEPIKITKGAITFIDDDCYLEAMNNWETINRLTGVKPTCALITGRVGNKKIVSWDDVQRLDALGFEFVSHTHNHINLTKVDEGTIREDLEYSVRLLEEHHLNSKVLVYPYISHKGISKNPCTKTRKYDII